MKYSKQFLFFASSFCLFTAQAQLVNIEAKRMATDSIRFVFTGDVLGNYTDNNGEFVLRIGSNISTQLKSKDLKEIYFLVLNYNLVRTRNEDFQNAWFAHLRYNHKLSQLVRVEAFVQDQYNTQLTVERRMLVGAGVRTKIVDSPNTSCYLGNSYMYEVEHLAAGEEQFYNHRNSTYLSFNQSFTKTRLLLTGTIYFQPLYQTIKNHRILSQFKAELPLTKVISVSALYNYAYTQFDSTLKNDRSSNINLGATFNL